MPCYHPKKAWSIRDNLGHFIKPVFSKDPPSSWVHKHLPYEELTLPCNRCIGCMLERSRQWMLRASFEATYYPPNSCWFVTLTYDDDHLPMREFDRPTEIELETGEVLKYETDRSMLPVLEPRDLTLFIKRLRSYFWRAYKIQGIKYLASGEYGSIGARPHYHLTLYGIPDLTIKPRSKLSSGFMDYQSPELDELWSQGRVSVSPFSPETAGYVARYNLKKAYGFSDEEYERVGLVPEFFRVSHGLSSRYLDDNYLELSKTDRVYFKGRSFTLPRFYLRKLSEDPEFYLLADTIKALRVSYAKSQPPPSSDLWSEYDEGKAYLEALEATVRSCTKSLTHKL